MGRCSRGHLRSKSALPGTVAPTCAMTTSPSREEYVRIPLPESCGNDVITSLAGGEGQVRPQFRALRGADATGARLLIASLKCVHSPSVRHCLRLCSQAAPGTPKLRKDTSRSFTIIMTCAVHGHSQSTRGVWQCAICGVCGAVPTSGWLWCFRVPRPHADRAGLFGEFRSGTFPCELQCRARPALTTVATWDAR